MNVPSTLLQIQTYYGPYPEECVLFLPESSYNRFISYDCRSLTYGACSCKGKQLVALLRQRGFGQIASLGRPRETIPFSREKDCNLHVQRSKSFQL